MSSPTAHRLREAAEDLLLENGQAATSLRDITERADANVAAVSYHFGSKDALIAQVYADALREVSEVQRLRLDKLPADASLEDLVRVWLAPALGPNERSARETKLWALIQRGMSERSPGLLENVDAIKHLVDTHLIDRLAALLPHLPREELMLRHNAVLASIGGLTSGDLPSIGGPPPEQTAPMLVTWIVGGLKAPSSARS